MTDKLTKDILKNKETLAAAIKPILDKKIQEKREQLKQDIAKKIFSEEVETNLAPEKALLKIMVHKTRMPVHFENGDTMEVDPQSSELLFTVINKFNKKENADRMKSMMVKSKSDFMKMLDFAKSFLTKGHENPGN